MTTLSPADPEYRSKLLIQHGFIKEEVSGSYFYNEKMKEYEPVEGYKVSARDADEEFIEIIDNQYGTTGFPSARKQYHLMWEVFDLSLEEPYFWILDTLKMSFPIVEKLEDSFAAAENSAFFGVTQQRLGAQQDKVSQFLATTGKMIKELFQMVRELRIIDERLDYYNGAEEQLKKPLDKRERGAEITLKGMFVDLVQGGGKSAASVYGMARELEYVTLPDLFFDAPPFKDDAESQRHIDGLRKDFNDNVLRVLHRHLHQFRNWKVRTHQEHQSRRKFMKAYLLQHYRIVEMYINWAKPYLRNVAKLSMKESSMDSPDLISAFEGSMLDVEILARKKKDKANGCILATFNYRTRPELKVVQEGYQRGPVHVGRLEMVFRVYGWTDQQVENYKKLKKKETLLLFGEISGSVRQAMEALGDELKQYLDEAEGDEKKEEKKSTAPAQKKKKSMMEALLGDFYTSPAKKNAEDVQTAEQLYAQRRAMEDALKGLVRDASGSCFGMYKAFKKGHRMVMW